MSENTIVYRPVGNVVLADLCAPCGRLFEGVVTIHDPRSDNPGIEITSPNGILGANALRMVINQVAEQVHLMWEDDG